MLTTNSITIQLADAVVAYLGTVTGLAKTIHPFRCYTPRYTLPEQDGVEVPVVPRSLVQILASRAMVDESHTIDIGILSKLPGTDATPLEAHTDPLLLLVEQLSDSLRGRVLTLASGGVAAWTGMANDPIYFPDHLTDLRQFTSVLSVTYKILRI